MSVDFMPRPGFAVLWMKHDCDDPNHGTKAAIGVPYSSQHEDWSRWDEEMARLAADGLNELFSQTHPEYPPLRPEDLEIWPDGDFQWRVLRK